MLAVLLLAIVFALLLCRVLMMNDSPSVREKLYARFGNIHGEDK